MEDHYSLFAMKKPDISKIFARVAFYFPLRLYDDVWTSCLEELVERCGGYVVKPSDDFEEISKKKIFLKVYDKKNAKNSPYRNYNNVGHYRNILKYMLKPNDLPKFMR